MSRSYRPSSKEDEQRVKFVDTSNHTLVVTKKTKKDPEGKVNWLKRNPWAMPWLSARFLSVLLLPASRLFSRVFVELTNHYNCVFSLFFSAEKEMSHTANKNKLIVMFTMTFIYFLVEIGVGYVSNSMALVADSFHMMSDVAALVVAFLSVKVGLIPNYGIH